MYDNSILQDRSFWAIQQRNFVELMPVETEQDFSLFDYLHNKIGSFFLKRLPNKEDMVKSDDACRSQPNNLRIALPSDRPSADLNVRACCLRQLADFSYMEKYLVRNGFMNYGSKVIFDDKDIISITYNGIIHTTFQTWLINIVKSTICIIGVVEIHLTRLHIQTAQKNYYTIT